MHGRPHEKCVHPADTRNVVGEAKVVDDDRAETTAHSTRKLVAALNRWL
jgi:hypothetical protein